MKFQESKLAHKFLDGLSGIEIGGSAHNSFGLNTKNVDYTDNMKTIYKLDEITRCGECMSVDIVARGDELPLPDKSQDFIISSHVLEHFSDPIKALKEWDRVIRNGGYIFMIVPHKDRTFDKDNERTTLKELIDRHEGKIKIEENFEKHHSIWITEDLIELINYLGWGIVFIQDIDDKVGNGFTIVIQKGKHSIDLAHISNNIRKSLYEEFDCLLKSEKDVEVLTKSLKNKAKTELIEKDKQKLEKDSHIQNLTTQVRNLSKEIEMMRRSKFWKLRNQYIFLKNKLFGLKKLS